MIVLCHLVGFLSLFVVIMQVLCLLYLIVVILSLWLFCCNFGSLCGHYISLCSICEFLCDVPSYSCFELLCVLFLCLCSDSALFWLFCLLVVIVSLSGHLVSLVI